MNQLLIFILLDDTFKENIVLLHILQHQVQYEELSGSLPFF